jgi:hypothetical protein
VIAAVSEGERGRFVGWLCRRSHFKRLLAEPVDLSPFKEPPSRKLLIGLALIGVSFVLGWPLIAVVGGVAVYLRNPWIAVLGGPAVWWFSHFVWTAGMFVAGPDSLYYGNLLTRWWLRRVLLWVVGRSVE